MRQGFWSLQRKQEGPAAVTVLVVDASASVHKSVRAALAANEFFIDTAPKPEDALEYIGKRVVDLVLLDSGVADVNSAETCRQIREIAPRVGIVLLALPENERDNVLALDAGADACVAKPLHPLEFAARLRAVLRRRGSGDARRTSVIRVGELVLDLQRRTLRKGGREVHLTPTEFDLLAVLMQHLEQPVTHTILVRTVWSSGDLRSRHLRSYVKTLRKKIETNPARPEYILTEPSIGYRFHNPRVETKSA